MWLWRYKRGSQQKSKKRVLKCEESEVEEEKQEEEEATIVLPAAVEQVYRTRMGRAIKAHRWRGSE